MRRFRISGVYGSIVNKKTKKSNLKSIYFFGGSGITTVSLDANGYFYIPANDLIHQNGKANYLVVEKDFNEKYNLEIKDYSADFDTKLFLTTLPVDLSVSELIEPSGQLISVLSGRVPREVTIQGKTHKNIHPQDIFRQSGNFWVIRLPAV